MLLLASAASAPALHVMFDVAQLLWGSQSVSQDTPSASMKLQLQAGNDWKQSSSTCPAAAPLACLISSSTLTKEFPSAGASPPQGMLPGSLNQEQDDVIQTFKGGCCWLQMPPKQSQRSASQCICTACVSIRAMHGQRQAGLNPVAPCHAEAAWWFWQLHLTRELGALPGHKHSLLSMSVASSACAWP